MAGTYEGTYRLEKSQILTFFESDEGKSVLNSLQDQEGCTIVVGEFETDTSTPINISFLKQQITEVSDDVIVSSVGRNLNMKTGQLSRCILEAAGEDIVGESRQKYPAGLSFAEIVQTSGGKLKCKAIYHCCLPQWDSKECRPDDVLRQVVSDCISKASSEGYKSIAFPALGSGNLGYPKYVTAAAIVDTAREFDNVPLSLEDVHVVGLPEDLDFEKAYKQHTEKVTALQGKNSETIMIGKLGLVLLKGEITDDCADVIVHPTTKHLSFDSGDVSTSLRLKCGTGFVGECQNEESVIKTNGMVLTTAPGLQCKNILHAAPKHFGSWKKTVKKCIQHVDETNEYTSIAFPAVPPDMLRGSLEEAYEKAAWEMVDAIKTMQTSTVDMIRVFCPDQLATFKDAVFRAIPELSTKTGRLKFRIKDLKRRLSKTEIPAEDGLLETPGTSAMTKLQPPAVKHRNESVASVTVFCQENKCDAILSKLAAKCDEDYTRVVVDKRIQKLKSSQTEDLVAFAKKESVVVTIVQDSGEVHLKGAFHGLIKGCHHLDEILQTIADFGFVAYPICWERVHSEQKIFNVAEGSIEYLSVKNTFMTALGDTAQRATIFKIERIQSPLLYKQYQMEMQGVQKEHPSQDNERIMWHGTDVEAVPNINKYGFNRSYSGKNATLYGQGVYFAVNATTSSLNKYSPPDNNGMKHVYRARVLTGRYTKGDANMRDAPRVNTTGSVRFTSTTDNASRPSLFCIYRDTHSYPEYLISFQLSAPQTP